jgi:hypothetical protein
MVLVLASYGLRAQAPERIGAPTRNSRTSVLSSDGAPGGHGSELPGVHEGGREYFPSEHEEYHEEGHEGSGAGLFMTAEYLLVKPRRLPHDYAIRSTDPAANPIIHGNVINLDWDTVSAYRVGAGYRLEHGWEIGGIYTYLHSRDSQVANPGAGNSLFANLSAPISFDAVSSAAASSNLDMDLIDVEFARRWSPCERLTVRLAGGTRVGTIQQKLKAVYDMTNSGFGLSNTDNRINFDGVGLRFGGEAFFQVWDGLGLYAKGYSSMMAGNFTTRYQQFTGNGRTSIVDVTDKFDAVVPVTELGMGVRWQSENISLSVGYELQNFFNLVQAVDFLDSASFKPAFRTGDLSLEALTVSLGIKY